MPPVAPLRRHMAVARGFQQDQGGEKRQAQRAVEGELGGAFAVAEKLPGPVRRAQQAAAAR